MEEALVIYPAALVGHIVPFIELCKHILTHKPSLSIHIFLTITPRFNTSTISHCTTTIPSITFHYLPNLVTPSSNPNPLFENIHINTQNLHEALLSISKTHTIKALIFDLFCFHSLTVASKLKIPAYCFFTCSASALALFLHTPTIHNNTEKSLIELNTCIHIPGVPPVPSRDMPEPMLERGSEVYEIFHQFSLLMSKLEGVIVNTFEALEPRSLKAISDGLCVPNGPTPPIYCVGPLLASNKETKTELDECLSWLNSQPSKSVVFLCFGSMGVFSIEQLYEMANGLERSGQRFMWVVRNPTRGQSEKQNNDSFRLDSLLPEGFLDRTRDRGLVVKDWAPQVEVLNHDSVGGFVTHCGWNSVLEAVCAGVPMVAWPLYAEQRFNRVVLVKEMGVALWMRESNESGFVTASEVEERVRELMESETSELIRERVMVAKDKAKATSSTKGGSSIVALTKLIQSWES
uniref:Glycosyltransferase n=1 Tax=Glycyrrhiza uralensis TaxID=74613 RepID=A0A515L4A3_GLYUR|nr:UDP-glycosyltransferase UGT88A29 [Glycyrrhiza uralensis]